MLPEHLLVLTYNVKAAAELRQRLEATVGVAVAGRMAISNYHSFCQGILTEYSADAGLPPRPDVLDGIGQVLLIKDLRPDLGLVYHGTDWYLGDFVRLINRCKDELVTTDDFDAFVAEEQRVYEDRFGSYAAAVARLMLQGNLAPLRAVRGDYAKVRANERAEERGEERTYRPDEAARTADREARRTIAGTGRAQPASRFSPEDQPRITQLAATYEADGAALEVMRLTELARVYRAYEQELARRGALDYGEQIAAVAQLLRTRTNVLRRLQRQYRYLLVDEFQDANVAQIELIELLGRTPDRPDNVMVVGDDDQSIYRFRGASYAAFAEFDARFSRPPAHAPDGPPPGPPTRLRLEQNFRSVRHVLTAAGRLIEQNRDPLRGGQAARDRPRGWRPDPGRRLRRPRGRSRRHRRCHPGLAQPRRRRRVPLSSIAVLYRKHKHRDAIVARLRDEDIPYTVVGGLSLFDTPEIRDLEQSMRAIADPHDGVAIVRMLTAGPWRLDALDPHRGWPFDQRGQVSRGRSIVDHAKAMADDDGHRCRPPGEAADAAGPHRGAPSADVPRGPVHDPRAVPGADRAGPRPDRRRTRSRASGWSRTSRASCASRPTGRRPTRTGRWPASWTTSMPTRQAGGELPTSVELTEDVDGVRLMTLYQAKGLEFPVVFVPSLLEGSGR
ncbi:MAG: ATP-dependent helicase [Candidatus Limnocylindrales bacterium]